MSPEQLHGQAVDHRSDVFSLGVVLFEMATGRHPFAGSSPAGLISSILRDPAPVLSDLNAAYPEDVAGLVRRCLEKDPARRYQSLYDLVSAARRHGPVASPGASESGSDDRTPAQSLAVLPFATLSNDKEQEFFGAGLTEDIICGLSRFRELAVIARDSSFRYQARANDDLRRIGRELGASYLVVGSVRRAATRIRVTAQLVEASSGHALWAETYDRDLTAGDIFAIQDEMTERIVGTVADQHGVLARRGLEAATEKPTESLDAYECVLRVQAFYLNPTPDEHASAGRPRASGPPRPGLRRCLELAGVSLSRRSAPRVQPKTRSSRACPFGCPPCGGARTDPSNGPQCAGGGPLPSPRSRGLSRRS